MDDKKRREQFARLFKIKRIARGLSQQDVSQRAKIAQFRVSQIENGVGSLPTLGSVWKLCDALGLQLIIVDNGAPVPVDELEDTVIDDEVVESAGDLEDTSSMLD